MTTMNHLLVPVRRLAGTCLLTLLTLLVAAGNASAHTKPEPYPPAPEDTVLYVGLSALQSVLVAVAAALLAALLTALVITMVQSGRLRGVLRH